MLSFQCNFTMVCEPYFNLHNKKHSFPFPKLIFFLHPTCTMFFLLYSQLYILLYTVVKTGSKSIHKITITWSKGYYSVMTKVTRIIIKSCL